MVARCPTSSSIRRLAELIGGRLSLVGKTEAAGRLPEEDQAVATGTHVGRDSGAHRVGTLAADETARPCGQSSAELDPQHAMRAANDQCCVGRRWALMGVTFVRVS